MKICIFVFIVFFAFNAIADSIVTESFVYDGSQNSIELILNGKKTHTEYQNVPSICTRQEVVGYRTVCTGPGYGPGYPRPYPRPYPGPGYPGPGYPYPGPMRQCFQEPIYRNVSYNCTIQKPNDVWDYDVSARVIVDVTNMSEEVTPGEKILVTLIGDSLSFKVEGSKKFFVVKKKQDVHSSMNGSVKMIDGLLAVELVTAAPILKAIKMTNIAIKDSVLDFDIGEVEARKNVGFSLKVEKKKLFGSDKVLLDRVLTDSEVLIEATEAGANAKVNVNQLGVQLESGKYALTAKAFVKVNGDLLNKDQFENDLEASRTLIYKIR